MHYKYTPFKFKFLKKEFGDSNFSLLDVGTGNHSATYTKRYLPNCKYYGLDINKDYNNNEDDFLIMEEFYEKDLTKLDFSDIPDNFFDAIIMSHIIEHLINGDMVIEKLLSKLKENGVIYIEYPSNKSIFFPHKRGTLNFLDDPSHYRIYTITEIYNILLRNRIKIIKGGTKRELLKIILLPINCIHKKIKLGYVSANVFWDLLGFSEYVYAKKV